MVTEHVDVLVDGELHTVRVRALTEGQREAYYVRERTNEPGILVYNPPKFVAIYRGVVEYGWSATEAAQDVVWDWKEAYPLRP